ncbi:hypothetical protein QF031_000945 [Pseudarthrobacter defluvii]|uniref:hypothetical protein n=1 Tax=Pseudarthrobacter defluvii TaxID=410837 RepID=UPI00278196B8|nr:hypothetical protein [Pseudarthrobacter defluvii]MDQ0768196.1 hypothetical protein [Pseudarthrobacter defluvii]
MIENEFSLFDIPETATPRSPSVLPDLPIRDDQVQEIRAAFDEAGIVEQTARKSLIESVSMREVASLRDLRAVEARRIVQRIKDTTKPKATGSSWDTREEDTWIDKL